MSGQPNHLVRLPASRKERDSNPRYEQSRTADFESAPIDHSGIFPLNETKIETFFKTAKCHGKI